MPEAGPTPKPEDQDGTAPKEFSPITTQEEFDKRIKARIDRLEKQHERKTQQLQSELDAEKARADTAEGELAEKNAAEEVTAWKKEASAASGVPANVLRGSTKEEIEAHAESLKEHFAKDAAPVVDAGSPSTDEGQAGDPLREAIMQGL